MGTEPDRVDISGSAPILLPMRIPSEHDALDDILLTGFSEADGRGAADALGRLGRAFRSGEPGDDRGTAFILAAAYDEGALRARRAAAFGEGRPWAFCVPAADRALVAAAAAAPEGRLLLLPVDDRELRRVLASLAADARERSSGAAAFSGLERLEASFSWRGDGLDVSRVGRALARLLADARFYPDRAGEDGCALALEEALVNALEHGNLGLDSSLKPDDPAAEDRYEIERRKRLADPELGARAVRVELSIAAGLAELAIEDAGDGFDVSRIGRGRAEFDVSGKGYLLIARPFDTVSYNAKGNKVTLAKRARPERRQ